MEAFMKTIGSFLIRGFFLFCAIYCFLYAFGFGIVDIINPAEKLGYLQTIQLINDEKVKNIQLHGEYTNMQTKYPLAKADRMNNMRRIAYQ